MNRPPGPHIGPSGGPSGVQVLRSSYVDLYQFLQSKLRSQPPISTHEIQSRLLIIFIAYFDPSPHSGYVCCEISYINQHILPIMNILES